MKNYILIIFISFMIICCNNNEGKLKFNDKKDSTFLINKVNTSNPNCDTAFIKELKNFFYKEIGFVLKGDFYTDTSNIEDSLYILGVSLPNIVEKPPEFKMEASGIMKFLMKHYNIKIDIEKNTIDFYRDNELKRVIVKYKESKDKGYHVAIMNGNTNSSTLLNNDLPSSKEGLSIVVFHELMHNYIYQKNFQISNKYNEAICSVIGNYLALKYSNESNITDSNFIKKHILISEKIYGCINDYIIKINNNGGDANNLNKECQKEINLILEDSDSLQIDMFSGKVNNAYLILYSDYSNKYFDIKELYLKHPNTKDFLKVLYKFLLSDQDYTSFL